MHEKLKQAAKSWLKAKITEADEADLALEDALVCAGFPVVGDPIEMIKYRHNTVVITLESELQIVIPVS